MLKIALIHFNAVHSFLTLKWVDFRLEKLRWRLRGRTPPIDKCLYGTFISISWLPCSNGFADPNFN